LANGLADYKFAYAALKNDTCRCGSIDGLQSYNKVADTFCNINCSFIALNGSVIYPCGGIDSYTVYDAKSVNYKQPEITSIEKKLDIMYDLTLNKNIHYKGCFKDSQLCGKRVLSRRCNSFNTITIDQCVRFCREGNFVYAGLETMVQCYCDNTYDEGQRVETEHCSASCPGNNSQLCGGSWSISIYDVTPIPNNITETPFIPTILPPSISTSFTITTAPSYNIILVTIGICIICIYKRFF
jgi:hypothetical protein